MSTPKIYSSCLRCEQLERELEAARKCIDALEFYAEPGTYLAIGFFPDPPCGEFWDDFSDTEEFGERPGKRAREALETYYRSLAEIESKG